ncbi:MAG TPA: hypothetical protein VIK91_11110, partial [Nannocystis sp.]
MTIHARTLCLFMFGSITSACVASWPLPEICPEAGCSTGEPVSSSTTGSPDTGEPTGGGFQTVTGAPTSTQADEPMEPPPPPETTGTTSPPEENEPPTVKLKVEPGHLAEAGQALLLLEPSPDVVTVRVSMNGVPLAELAPSDFPYVAFEALSAKDNTVEPHVFEVEVEDEGGLTASATAMLTVQ